MRKRLVDSYTDPATSITYGLRGSPVDFSLAQKYTNEHVAAATRDFLTKAAAGPVVEGFDYTLAGQLKLSIAAGRAYDPAGVFYETITDPPGGAALVTLDAADPALARVDLVYAVLESGVQAVPLTRMFRRVASEAELTANNGRNPYLPQPIERFAEEHARARVLVRKGVAAANPVAPAANAGEAPLFQVRVNVGAAVLVAGNVTDVRNRARSLAQALALIDALYASPAILNFNETVDDRVNDLLVDSLYLTKSYNDAGNLLTVDVDVPALGPALDTRFVKKAGDTMSGALKVDIGGGSDPYPTNNAGLRGVNNGPAGTAPVGVYGYGQAGLGNGDVAYGGFFHANANRGNVAAFTTSYGVYAETGGGAARWAGYFNGNVHCAGSFSKSNGTFLVDHPLDPANRDLVHGFVESSEYLIIYRVTVVLAGGAANVDLDAYLGFTAGTLAELADGLAVYSLYSEGAAHVAATIAGATLTLASADAGDTSQVNLLVAARRKDPYIKLDPWVDADGSLIPEHDKQAPGAGSDLQLVSVEVDDPRAGTFVTRVDVPLVGRSGFPRYPAVAHAGEEPSVTVAYVPPGWEAAGPALPTAAAEAPGYGSRHWEDAESLFAEDGASAWADIGSLRHANTAYLVATGYGLSVPAGATIQAVLVEVKRKLSNATRPFSAASDNVVALVVGGVPQTDYNQKAEGVDWPDGYYQVQSYYFTPSLLPGGLTPEAVSSADFGVALSARLDFNDVVADPGGTASVDTIKVTVFYTPAG